MDWYSEGERVVDCGVVRVGRGRLEERLGGSLFERFSGVGDWPLGECREEVIGVCAGVEIESRDFFRAGSADFGGLPGPLFWPVVGSCVCAILLLQLNTISASYLLLKVRRWKFSTSRILEVGFEVQSQNPD